MRVVWEWDESVSQLVFCPFRACSQPIFCNCPGLRHRLGAHRDSLRDAGATGRGGIRNKRLRRCYKPGGFSVALAQLFERSSKGCGKGLHLRLPAEGLGESLYGLSKPPSKIGQDDQ